MPKKNALTAEVVSSETSPVLSDTEKLKLDLRERELIETDVTTRVVLRTIREALDAVIILKEGCSYFKTTEPDHEMRLKAVREAREILGMQAPKNNSMRIPKITIIADGTVGVEVKL